MFVSLVLWNNTNQALSAVAANHILQYSQLNYGTPAPLVYA